MPFSASPDIAAQRQFTPSSTAGQLARLLALLAPEGDGTMTITSTGAGTARLVPVGDGTMTITSGG